MKKNVIHLLIYQVFNFIIPLAMLPFLVSVLSSNAYQSLVINQTMVMISIAFVNYGFDVKGVTRLVEVENSKRALLISTIYVVKTCLFVFISMLYIFLSIEVYGIGTRDVLFGLAWIVSFIPLNVWFYSFKERFDIVSKWTILPKVFLLPFVFLAVSNDSDTWKYFAIYGAASFITNICLFRKMLCIERGLTLVLPKVKNVKEIFVDGFGFFISQLSVMLMTNVFTLLLPIWLTPHQFTVFNVADRAIRIISMLTSPFTNALFPVMAKLIRKNRQEAFRKISHFIFWSVGVTVFGYVAYYFIGELILSLLFPDIYHELYSVILFMLIVPFFIFVNNLLGTQIGINFGKDKDFSKVILLSGIINISLSVLVIPDNGVYGAAFVVIFSQFLLLIGMFSVARSCGYSK
ncbi:oligosaccharide flippase family protein [Aeromonas enteropelogenes]|uniref:oligosaccharide flippase family protein n=1 Tax=Aeromonas enteropelogenes TaxID=29489 RepID=UPI00191CBA2A|nr:oligosaccharide flippase family protein [Aeromonas enteropelogenes]MBL0455923.1 oligosaccharide flippase family protein [Aeromonas enteropelogenes]